MIDCLAENWIFYSCILIAGSLSFLPLIGKFLNVCNTLIHESAHAIMTLLTSGEVVQIQLHADAGGAAHTKSKYFIGKILTSLAGYPASSLASYILFKLIVSNKLVLVFYTLFSLVLVNLVLWVRNLFGIVWLVVFGALLLSLYLYGNHHMQLVLFVIIASVVLAQSVGSTFTLLWISVKFPAKAGDAKNLKDFTRLPAILWSLLFTCFALYMAWKTVLIWPCIQHFFEGQSHHE